MSSQTQGGLTRTCTRPTIELHQFRLVIQVVRAETFRERQERNNCNRRKGSGKVRNVYHTVFRFELWDRHLPYPIALTWLPAKKHVNDSGSQCKPNCGAHMCPLSYKQTTSGEDLYVTHQSNKITTLKIPCLMRRHVQTRMGSSFMGRPLALEGFNPKPLIASRLR